MESGGFLYLLELVLNEVIVSADSPVITEEGEELDIEF
jgi:hypothetical protein